MESYWYFVAQVGVKSTGTINGSYLFSENKTDLMVCGVTSGQGKIFPIGGAFSIIKQITRSHIQQKMKQEMEIPEESIMIMITNQVEISAKDMHEGYRNGWIFQVFDKSI